MTTPETIGDLARFITSKNAGPYLVTIDIVFPDEQSYRRVLNAGIITVGNVAKAYRRDPSDIVGIHEFEPARAIKITMRRDVPAGSPGDHDVYGAQQHVPVMTMRVDAP